MDYSTPTMQTPAMVTSMDYVSVQIDRSARTALQRLQFRLSSDTARRLTMTEALTAALAVADQHYSEVLATAQPTDT